MQTAKFPKIEKWKAQRQHPQHCCTWKVETTDTEFIYLLTIDLKNLNRVGQRISKEKELKIQTVANKESKRMSNYPKLQPKWKIKKADLNKGCKQNRPEQQR